MVQYPVSCCWTVAVCYSSQPITRLKKKQTGPRWCIVTMMFAMLGILNESLFYIFNLIMHALRYSPMVKFRSIYIHKVSTWSSNNSQKGEKWLKHPCVLLAVLIRFPDSWCYANHHSPKPMSYVERWGNYPLKT